LGDVRVRLQVLGNVKGVVATVVSVILFRNTVSWAGCLGYAIAIAGVFMYGEQRRKSSEVAATAAAAAATKQDSLELHADYASAGSSGGSGAASPLLYSMASAGATSNKASNKDLVRSGSSAVIGGAVSHRALS
jgi:drug/metabolite transporter (DMT)-like permease